MKDLKLSAGELGRFSSSTSATGSSLTRGPGLRHLRKNTKLYHVTKSFFYLLLKQMAASNCGVVEISLQATHLFELQQLTNQEQQRKNSTRSKSNTLSRVRPNTCHKLHRVKVTVDHRSCLRCTPLDISIYLLIIICPAVCGSFLSQRLLCLYI